MIGRRWGWLLLAGLLPTAAAVAAVAFGVPPPPELPKEFFAGLALAVTTLGFVAQLERPQSELLVVDKDGEVRIVLDPRKGQAVWINSIKVQMGQQELRVPQDLPCRFHSEEDKALTRPWLLDKQVIVCLDKAELAERLHCEVCGRQPNRAKVRVVVEETAGDERYWLLRLSFR